MSDKIAVSIIVPVFNRAALVGDAVESALSAAPEIPIEVIVVDDASTDDTWARLSEYDDPRVKAIRLERNSGQCTARNRGLDAARGRYVKFLDSDDLLYPGHLGAEVGALDSGAEIAVSGWCYERSDHATQCSDAPSFGSIVDDVLAGRAVPTSAALYRRRADWRWDPALRKLDDWDYFCQTALGAARIVTVPGHAYVIRHHGGARATDAGMLANAREHHYILNKIERRLAEERRLTPERRRRLAQYYYKELRVLCLHDRDAFDAAVRRIRELDPAFQPRDEESQPFMRALARITGFGAAIRLHTAVKKAVRPGARNAKRSPPRHRLAIVASHVIQYQDPFFRALAADPRIDLTVFYCSRAGAEVYRDTDMQTSLRWDIEMLQGYRHRFLRNFGRGEGYTRLINPGIVAAIARGRFDAVLFFLGWGTVTSLLGIGACRVTGVPFLLYGDSSFPPPETSWRDRFRAALLRRLFAAAGAFMVSGKLNAAYYEHYGADPRRFFLLPWAIDNERFARASRFAPGEREKTRARFGIAPDDVAFVFSAKLVPRKDPMTLLRAVVRMSGRDRAVVVFLGHGELRQELESFAAEHRLATVFAGFVNQSDLPKHYAMCDAFVLPSTYEPRGAVINEAMACGLPVVVTDRCGSLGDIVRENDNALVYPAGDADALAVHLDRLLDEPLRRGMGQRSREIIASWDYARGVAGVEEALAFVAKERR